MADVVRSTRMAEICLPPVPIVFYEFSGVVLLMLEDHRAAVFLHCSWYDLNNEIPYGYFLFVRYTGEGELLFELLVNEWRGTACF